ncbi:MAG: 2Fe-2S iron-sulfur cluster binding domain-containing protein [Geminicoccaceae bacterium]|nr:2Fe-2S iron-sulfur cluster binding domain-containing protein [Geminicoccaceae bacterium]
MNDDPATVGAIAAGFRRLKVVDRVAESATITSFHLEPVDVGGWRDFEPGQFLVFRLPGDGTEGGVVRNYSVSSSPLRPGRYRITVKREPAPERAGGAGLGSGHFHDRVAIGDEILAEGPRGAFTLDRTSPRPVVLLAGGVGLTPLVSMLHALATETDRTVHFIHACDNGDLHALGDEVEAVARSRPGIHAHFCYRQPTERDLARKRHRGTGLVTRELLQSLLPLDDYDVYLCGPTPFMKGVFGILRGLGIARERIKYEFFGPASLLEEDAAAPVILPAAAVPEAPSVSTDGITDAAAVEFRRSGIQASWTDKAPSLLDFAESQGLTPEFSCRAGICSTCKTRLLSGEVEYFEEPLDPPAEGEVLICCSRPKGPVVLDL